MKAGVSANEFWMRLQVATTLSLHLLQFVKRRESPISQRLIGKWPEALCGLQLGRVGRQEHQMEAFGNRQLGTLMPPCSVYQQDDLFVRVHPCLLRKDRQRLRKGLDVDGRQEQPTGASTCWVHKGVDIHPLIRGPNDGSHRRAFGRPYPPQNRLEAYAMFITTPQFHLTGRVGLTNNLNLLGQFF